VKAERINLDTNSLCSNQPPGVRQKGGKFSMKRHFVTAQPNASTLIGIL